jgi:aminopeptidase
MNKTRLKAYARLIARCGVNVQKGQEVMISAAVDQGEFVEMLVAECYKAGAAKVVVDFHYDRLTKLHVKYRSEKVLSSLDAWELARWEHQAEVLPCKIYLTSDDPDGLRGINVKKLAASSAKKAKLIKPIRNKMENKYQWCIAAVPGREWAKKLFPKERVSRAIELLWDAILTASRVDGDPIEAWRIHNESLHSKCEYLNSLGLKELRYKAGNGTDLTVGLIPDGIFMGGGENALGSGIFFNPNIPSEEVFTSPMKGVAEGIVYSSLPLSYQGQLIENFWFKFKDGKVVEHGAEKNDELLSAMLSMDEGASYLGECALVPFSSPINKTGILFYNTLFDENAVCHFAVGRGFSNLLVDYEKYTEEEAKAKGINDSISHVDFMIGTRDLSVIGVTRDGREIEIFKDGEWAI